MQRIDSTAITLAWYRLDKIFRVACRRKAIVAVIVKPVESSSMGAMRKSVEMISVMSMIMKRDVSLESITE
ncbi:MAG: hypothetical protein ACE5GZ_06605 [Gammaproteobacteria bacterium]